MPSGLLDLWRTQDGTLMVAGDIEKSHGIGFEELLVHDSLRGPVTLNLSLVTYLPRITLHAIVVARRDPRAHRLDVHAQSGSIAQRVLAMAGVEHTAL